MTPSQLWKADIFPIRSDPFAAGLDCRATEYASGLAQRKCGRNEADYSLGSTRRCVPICILRWAPDTKGPGICKRPGPFGFKLFTV